MSDLALTIGVQAVFAFRCTDGNGVPLDLTGAAVQFLATDGGSLSIDKTIEGGGVVLTSAAAGEGTVTVAAADTSAWPAVTARLSWRLIVTLPASSPADLDSGYLTARAPATPPATCTISGTAPANAIYRIRIGRTGTWQVARSDEGILVDARAVAGFVGADGAFSFTVPQGFVFLIDLPASDLNHTGVAPYATTADLGTLELTIWRGV